MGLQNNDQDTVKKYERFLSVSGTTEFIYDAAADMLEVFRFAPDKTEVYSGKLDDWGLKAMIPADENTAEQMKVFLDALRASVSDWQGHIDMPDGRHMIRFRTYQDDGNKSYGVLIAPASGRFSTIPAYRRLSDKDAMLDMLNKRAITEYAQKVCEQKNCPTTYIIMFDLDNFKVVNDSYGHMFGDEVLHTVTAIIKKAFSGYGMIGRVGGDEIMIVTKNIADKSELRPFMREIRVNVEEQFKDKLNGISLTCSMGAAAYPDHGDSYNRVLDIADKMLYLAKEKGRNRYIIYTPEMHSDLVNGPAADGSLKNLFEKSFDKIGIIHYMMEDYLKKGISSNEHAFANVGEAFKLQEVLIVYDNGKVGFRWAQDNTGLRSTDLAWMELTDDFYSLFDNDDLFIVDGLYDLVSDSKREHIRKKLIERGAESALFYRIRHDGISCGFVMFVKRGQRQKWSEYELLALSTIGKIFELSVQDQSV